MTDSLPDRLRAAMADEALRLSELPPWPWKLNAEGDEILAKDDEEICTAWALSSQQQRAVASWIADNDPAAKLRRITADRKILDLHPRTYSPTHSLWMCNPCDHPHPCPTVEALAEAYGIEP